MKKACQPIIDNADGRSILAAWRIVFFEAVWAVPRGGRLHGFRASFAALGAEKALAFHGGFRTRLLAGSRKVLRHWDPKLLRLRQTRFMQV